MRRRAVEARHGGAARAGAHRAPRSVRCGGRCSEQGISTSRAGRQLARRARRAAAAGRRRRGRRRAAAARTCRAEAGHHLGEPVGRVRVARAVLGVAVQRQVGQHEPEAVAELLDQRLPLAVRQPGGVQQRERRAGARLAVGDPRAVGVVVEAQLHARRDRRVRRGCSPLPLRPRDPPARGPGARRAGRRAAVRARRHGDRRPLGTPQLAALAIAATVLSTVFTVFNFLAYGTTAQVARLHGAGEEDEAARSARRRCGSRSRSASCCSSPSRRLAAARRAMGGEGEVADGAHYLRIAALGAPAFMLAQRRPGLPARHRRPAHAARHPRRRPRGQRRARGAVRLRLRLGPRGLGVGHGDRPARHGRGVLRRPARAPAGSAPGLGADAPR